MQPLVLDGFGSRLSRSHFRLVVTCPPQAPKEFEALDSPERLPCRHYGPLDILIQELHETVYVGVLRQERLPEPFNEAFVRQLLTTGEGPRGCKAI